MRARVQEKNKAIELRKKGYSYNDILKEVPVAKSSLSLWLKDLPLTAEEKRYMKKRKDANISHGRIKAAAANRKRRLERDKILLEEARKEFASFVKDPLFHTGIALYWAEGAKRSTFFAFSNSDPKMIFLMVSWIETFFGLSNKDVRARLYIHKPYAHENCEQFWAKQTNLPSSNFRKTVYKPTGLLVKKRPNYRGCLRIELGPTKYLKKIMFWQNMLVEYYTNK